MGHDGQITTSIHPSRVTEDGFLNLGAVSPVDEIILTPEQSATVAKERNEAARKAAKNTIPGVQIPDYEGEVADF